MSRFVDRTGKRFGKLTVVERAQGKGKGVYWRCRCDCGNEVIVQSNNLHSGHTTSCGCAKKEIGEKLTHDLTGMKFNRLTVIKMAEKSRTGETRWLCKCDCGKETIVQANNLKSGMVKSCGCLSSESARDRHLIHGGAGTKLFKVWLGIRRRCYEKENASYKDYGARGITVCDEWRNDFSAFRDWALKNGYKDGLSIDRIDNDGPYAQWNCRWATATEQARNRRSNHLLTFNGETHTIVEWAEITGLPRSTLNNRVQKYGWSVDRALTEPYHNMNWKKAR